MAREWKITIGLPRGWDGTEDIWSVHERDDGIRLAHIISYDKDGNQDLPMQEGPVTVDAAVVALRVAMTSDRFRHAEQDRQDRFLLQLAKVVAGVR
jgi:hypothetical protein